LGGFGGGRARQKCKAHFLLLRACLGSGGRIIRPLYLHPLHTIREEKKMRNQRNQKKKKTLKKIRIATQNCGHCIDIGLPQGQQYKHLQVAGKASSSPRPGLEVGLPPPLPVAERSTPRQRNEARAARPSLSDSTTLSPRVRSLVLGEERRRRKKKERMGPCGGHDHHPTVRSYQ
jgi:hypothetical protein